jgi:ribosomal protein L33
MKCKHCGQETNNPHFCNRFCSASHNNRESPKRVKQKRFCKHCSVEITARRTTCDQCNPSYVDWSDVTLKEVRSKATFQYSARIRQVARNLYRQSTEPKQCFVCGYNRHYEVCHKRPIRDFSDSSLVSEVNDINNLVALCPNHYWEFDNGLIIF